MERSRQRVVGASAGAIKRLLGWMSERGHRQEAGEVSFTRYTIKKCLAADAGSRTNSGIGRLRCLLTGFMNRLIYLALLVGEGGI